MWKEEPCAQVQGDSDSGRYWKKMRRPWHWERNDDGI